MGERKRQKIENPEAIIMNCREFVLGIQSEDRDVIHKGLEHLKNQLDVDDLDTIFLPYMSMSPSCNELFTGWSDSRWNKDMKMQRLYLQLFTSILKRVKDQKEII